MSMARRSAPGLDNAPRQRPEGLLRYPYLVYEYVSIALVSLFAAGYIIGSIVVAVVFLIEVYTAFFDPILGRKLIYLGTTVATEPIFKYLFIIGVVVVTGVVILATLGLVYDWLRKAYLRVVAVLT
jgi:hypothetical protein